MKKILGAAVGGCVHVAGILSFLSSANKIGFQTKFLGTAVSAENLLKEINNFKPDIIGISYRLSPESAGRIFWQLKQKLDSSFNKSAGKKVPLILGTTKPVAAALKKTGLVEMFEYIFTGGEKAVEIEAFLKNISEEGRYSCEGKSGNLKIPFGVKPLTPPQNLQDRIKFKEPFPLLRHHFGRPSLKETIEGLKIIAESSLIDIISIGPDQNAQEFFFKPEKMDNKKDGAGGVPIRSAGDLKMLYSASRTGNYPLMRCYSGTNNILKFAEVLTKTINNAWCAVPLCWYNELDGRSHRKLEDSIAENQSVMKWHAQRNIPVEVNESHQWSLRYTSDSVAVATAFLAAYNAKKMGAATYVSQYMFNTPPETSFTMDLAKMLAKIEMIEALHDDNFKSIRQTRTGLYSMSGTFKENKGQLASSTLLQMQLDPEIVHVVAFCESEHAARPDDIIESSEIVKKVIENYLNGCPDMKNERNVKKRKAQLINDANLIIDAIKKLDTSKKYKDPLVIPEIIGKAIRIGILDAPHLNGSSTGRGKMNTMFFNGACMAVDDFCRPLSEAARLAEILF
ncbi:MAG: cobalamin B12-binding domain-containing protein [Actinobacteria bacterium]|nr:cobalamin B12-binding domain-containing protein [Actinomycetota bacterium]